MLIDSYFVIWRLLDGLSPFYQAEWCSTQLPYRFFERKWSDKNRYRVNYGVKLNPPWGSSLKHQSKWLKKFGRSRQLVLKNFMGNLWFIQSSYFSGQPNVPCLLAACDLTIVRCVCVLLCSTYFSIWIVKCSVLLHGKVRDTILLLSSMSLLLI